MLLSKELENMNDKQIQSIWKAVCEEPWCANDMYNESITMYDYSMIIQAEMDYRGLNKFI